MDYEPRRTKVILEGFDVLDTVRYIGKINKKQQAVLLSEIESIIGNTEIYPVIRKLILDSSNEFVRIIVRNIFGDIEY